MHNTHFSIREATLSDLDAIEHIERQSFESGWTRENLRKELSASFSIVLVAIADGTIAGYVSAWKITGELQINRLAVLAHHRRRGIARSLINELIANAKIQTPHKVLLEVRGKNNAARQLYQSLGFREVGIRKKYYHTDDAILLEKEITP
jgi:ribosomal-protein-alanine N-acetyltransferase